MKYKQLGQSNVQVSEIGYGCMSLGQDHTGNIKLLHRALELGVTFFDTADLYDRGFNEESVGRAFTGMREQVVIASKVGNRWREDGTSWDWDASPAYIRQAIEASLKRLQTDYLDLYQLHGGTLDDIDSVIETFEGLKAQGLIRAYGISSIRPNVIREWVKKSFTKTYTAVKMSVTVYCDRSSLVRINLSFSLSLPSCQLASFVVISFKYPNRNSLN